jgi:hypothetical protein
LRGYIIWSRRSFTWLVLAAWWWRRVVRCELFVLGYQSKCVMQEQKQLLKVLWPQVDNVLFTDDGSAKLCDFGSGSRPIVVSDARNIMFHQEELETITTAECKRNIQTPKVDADSLLSKRDRSSSWDLRLVCVEKGGRKGTLPLKTDLVCFLMWLFRQISG